MSADIKPELGSLRVDTPPTMPAGTIRHARGLILNRNYET